MIIGFCNKVAGWPSILKDLGYKVDWIEPKLFNSEGERVVPDIMLTSNKFCHSLIIECKGGKSANKEQIKKLSRLTVESIKDRASIYDPSRLNLDICFASFMKDSENIIRLTKKYSFPALLFSDTQMRREGEFKSKHLNEKLTDAIHLDGYPPTNYIPFTSDDDINLIASYVLQEIVSITLKHSRDDEITFDTEDILERIFPVWKKFDIEAKKKLRNRVDNILREISRRKLNEYLKKIKGRPTWVAKSLQAFRKECEKLLEDLGKKYTIQEKLF